MRLPCYDSPTAWAWWCRAVTSWQPLVYDTFMAFDEARGVHRISPLLLER